MERYPALAKHLLSHLADEQTIIHGNKIALFCELLSASTPLIDQYSELKVHILYQLSKIESVDSLPVVMRLFGDKEENIVKAAIITFNTIPQKNKLKRLIKATEKYCPKYTEFAFLDYLECPTDEGVFDFLLVQMEHYSNYAKLKIIERFVRYNQAYFDRNYHKIYPLLRDKESQRFCLSQLRSVESLECAQSLLKNLSSDCKMIRCIAASKLIHRLKMNIDDQNKFAITVLSAGDSIRPLVKYLPWDRNIKSKIKSRISSISQGSTVDQIDLAIKINDKLFLEQLLDFKLRSLDLSDDNSTSYYITLAAKHIPHFLSKFEGVIFQLHRQQLATMFDTLLFSEKDQSSKDFPAECWFRLAAISDDATMKKMLQFILSDATEEALGLTFSLGEHRCFGLETGEVLARSYSQGSFKLSWIPFEQGFDVIIESLFKNVLTTAMPPGEWKDFLVKLGRQTRDKNFSRITELTDFLTRNRSRWRQALENDRLWTNKERIQALFGLGVLSSEFIDEVTLDWCSKNCNEYDQEDYAGLMNIIGLLDDLEIISTFAEKCIANGLTISPNSRLAG